MTALERATRLVNRWISACLWLEPSDQGIELIKMIAEEITTKGARKMTYKFKNPFYTRASDIEARDAFGVKIVAVAGYGNDWAAYIGPIDWSDEMVAEQGDKLSPEQAGPLFPALRESGRRYRL